MAYSFASKDPLNYMHKPWSGAEYLRSNPSTEAKFDS